MTPEFITSLGHVRVTGDFFGICTRPVHAQDGDIQCLSTASGGQEGRNRTAINHTHSKDL